MSIYTLDTKRGKEHWIFSVNARDRDCVSLDFRAVGLRSIRGQAYMSALAAREFAKALNKAADQVERIGAKTNGEQGT